MARLKAETATLHRGRKPGRHEYDTRRLAVVVTAGIRRFGRVTSIMRGIGLLVDAGTWIAPGRLLACAYPRRGAALAGLARQGVSLVINLHEVAHQPARLALHGLDEVHVPVRDFTAPSPAQIERVLEAMAEALAGGQAVAVHCGAGLGRTGTLVACYLVRTGVTPDEAIRQVRTLRPGSVETRDQIEAVTAYAERLQHEGHSQDED